MAGAFPTVRVKFWVASGALPLLAVVVIWVLPVGVVLPDSVAVPSRLSTKEIPLGNDPVSVIVGAVFTVMVIGDVTEVPAALVTVSVYVVVAVGEMVIGAPLVADPTPLSILPVPRVNTAVSVVEAPEVMVVDPATKLVIVGAGTTVTVAVAVVVSPAVLLTVRV